MDHHIRSTFPLLVYAILHKFGYSCSDWDDECPWVINISRIRQRHFIILLIICPFWCLFLIFYPYNKHILMVSRVTRVVTIDYPLKRIWKKWMQRGDSAIRLLEHNFNVNGMSGPSTQALITSLNPNPCSNLGPYMPAQWSGMNMNRQNKWMDWEMISLWWWWQCPSSDHWSDSQRNMLDQAWVNRVFLATQKGKSASDRHPAFPVKPMMYVWCTY